MRHAAKIWTNISFQAHSTYDICLNKDRSRFPATHEISILILIKSIDISYCATLHDIYRLRLLWKISNSHTFCEIMIKSLEEFSVFQMNLPKFVDIIVTSRLHQKLLNWNFWQIFVLYILLNIFFFIINLLVGINKGY